MNLTKGHVAIINCATWFWCSYKRWKQMANVMLLKKPGNCKIHRLRVTMMIEADCNGLLGSYWRKTVNHAEDNNLFDDGQFSGRPGRTAHNPVLTEEPIDEWSRLTRKSHMKFANDATLCYDRMLASLASTASRKCGTPKSQHA